MWYVCEQINFASETGVVYIEHWDSSGVVAWSSRCAGDEIGWGVPKDCSSDQNLGVVQLTWHAGHSSVVLTGKACTRTYDNHLYHINFQLFLRFL